MAQVPWAAWGLSWDMTPKEQGQLWGALPSAASLHAMGNKGILKLYCIVLAASVNQSQAERDWGTLTAIKSSVSK